MVNGMGVNVKPKPFMSANAGGAASAMDFSSAPHSDPAHDASSHAVLRKKTTDAIESRAFRQGYQLNSLGQDDLLALRASVDAQLSKQGAAGQSRAVEYEWTPASGGATRKASTRVAYGARPHAAPVRYSGPAPGRRTPSAAARRDDVPPRPRLVAGPNIQVFSARINAPSAAPPDIGWGAGPSGPSVGKAYASKPSAQTEFSKRYRAGDLPVAVDHNGAKPQIRWFVKLDRVDFDYYLPLFFDGLRETRFPESLLAVQGVQHLVEFGGKRCAKLMPQLVPALKAGLQTRDDVIMPVVMHAIQHLLHHVPQCGLKLVPYYRAVLPSLAMYVNREPAQSPYDDAEAGTARLDEQKSINTVVANTLQIIAQTGGKGNFKHIKRYLPTYEFVN